MSLWDKAIRGVKNLGEQGVHLLDAGTALGQKLGAQGKLRLDLTRLALCLKNTDDEPSDKNELLIWEILCELNERSGMVRTGKDKFREQKNLAGLGKLLGGAVEALSAQLDGTAGELVVLLRDDEEMRAALLRLAGSPLCHAEAISYAQAVLKDFGAVAEHGARVTAALAGRRKTWSEFRTGFTRSEGRYGRLEQTTGLEDAARLLSLYGGFIDEVYGIRELNEQSRHSPFDPEVLIQLAEAHIARKSASLVLRIFFTVSNPFTLIPFGLIQAYKRGRKIPDTEVALARRVITALDAPAHKTEFIPLRGGRRAFVKARALMILGYHERAIRLLKYALLTLSNKTPVYFYLASAIAAQGDADAALSWYITGTEAGSAQCAAVLQNLVSEYRKQNPGFALSAELTAKMQQLLAVPEKKTDWQKVLSGFIDTKVEALDNLTLRLERKIEGWLAK